ncbi:hypothetical protein DEO72_LG5g2206 [Vigna unguiculata]|uniref:Uncharacterized protein n=1 Tax=Vigna unguiculata TaxID=3917 RepID=A0A4D6LZP4_VIGUN|nr:hypothetical protein DEO72_LG5g2206 [Vigna unguiculata]
MLSINKHHHVGQDPIRCPSPAARQFFITSTCPNRRKISLSFQQPKTALQPLCKDASKPFTGAAIMPTRVGLPAQFHAPVHQFCMTNNKRMQPNSFHASNHFFLFCREKPTHGASLGFLSHFSILGQHSFNPNFATTLITPPLGFVRRRLFVGFSGCLFFTYTKASQSHCENESESNLKSLPLRFPVDSTDNRRLEAILQRTEHVSADKWRRWPHQVVFRATRAWTALR